MKPTPQTLAAPRSALRCLVSLALCWGGSALAQAPVATAEDTAMELPLAPIVAVLVGLLVFLALRLRAWLRLEVEPALRALEQAAAGLRRRASPPVLRRVEVGGSSAPLVLGSEWIRPGEVSVVGGGGPELPLRIASELLAAGRGTVILGLARSDVDLIEGLAGLGVGAEPLAERLLRVEPEAALRDPGGLLAQVAVQPAPHFVVVGLSGGSEPARFVPRVREAAALAEPEVRAARASLVLVMLDGAPGVARLLADAPGVSEGRWLSGSALVFPTDESAVARADLG